jgi:uncharacterized membrane protein YgcG
MKAEKLLAAEQTVALAGVIVQDLTAQTRQERTLPRPRRIIAVLLFYGTLSLIASFGQGPARLAAAAGGVTALASLVLGAGGRAVVGLLNRGAVLAQPEAPGGGVAAPPASRGYGGAFSGSGGGGGGGGGGGASAYTPPTTRQPQPTGGGFV